ncbi:MAG TPA: thioredoxin family protein [Rhizobacter sp.]|nr:thioredoxin family protein [Rhizobacter sp.]
MSLWPRLSSLLMWLPLLVLAQPAVVVTEHVRAELVAHAPQGIGPGKDLRLGLLLQHEPHWHTYWKNPGDSGLPTRLSWQLPAGVSAGEIEWPTPQQLPLGPLMNHGYEGQVLLPVTVTLPSGFSAPTLDVKLHAEWLVCKDVCIPETGEFSLRLPAASSLAVHGALFEAARARVPREVDKVRAVARVEGEALKVEVDGLPAAARSQKLVFFAETGAIVDPAAPMAQRWEGERWVASLPLSSERSTRPAELHAVLARPGAEAGLRVRLAVSGWPAEGVRRPVATAAVPVAPVAEASLWLSLGLALIGGLLLNLMPCVFPVLSLKVLGFAQPGHARRELAAGGLAYTVGVVLSFVALAGLLLALRAGGEQLGWGFQLQSPIFVALLAAVFTLIGLNLAGVFEFGSVLPSGLATLRARHPVADHALTGVLAVAVASPCTAPFMGVALGTALTLPAAQALWVFAALGLGMAVPYLALSLSPGLAHRLPRPGVWMQRFKVLMAFPMFATVVWLLWVLGLQVGINGVAAWLVVLLALAFAAWVGGLAGAGRAARWGFGTAAVLLLAASLAWAWPSLQPAVMVAASSAPAGERWQPWSAAAVEQARAEGRPVFVDFTAAWCVTCQVNKLTTLSDPAVLAEFESRQVRLLRADWTRRDPLITAELTRLGRSGVPVYALYAPGTGAPHVLSELLSAGDIHQALSSLSVARAGEPSSSTLARSP